MANLNVFVTIILATVGYVITYTNGIRIGNRAARLKHLSDQIQFLYGPLFSLSHASQQAWGSFRSRYRPGGPFFGDPRRPLLPEELAAWRMWMTEVFMPLNLQMEAAIITNAHLIEGSVMPQPFLDLLSHVEVYRVILRKWKDGDFSEHTAYIDYPVAIDSYVSDAMNRLAAEQTKLLRRTT